MKVGVVKEELCPTIDRLYSVFDCFNRLGGLSVRNKKSTDFSNGNQPYSLSSRVFLRVRVTFWPEIVSMQSSLVNSSIRWG